MTVPKQAEYRTPCEYEDAYFESKVRPDSPPGHMLWIGPRKNRRDPVMHLRGHQVKEVMARRFAWERAFGPVPRGQRVFRDTSICEHKTCVNTGCMKLGWKGATSHVSHRARAFPGGPLTEP